MKSVLLTAALNWPSLVTSDIQVYNKHILDYVFYYILNGFAKTLHHTGSSNLLFLINILFMTEATVPGSVSKGWKFCPGQQAPKDTKPTLMDASVLIR